MVCNGAANRRVEKGLFVAVVSTRVSTMESSLSNRPKTIDLSDYDALGNKLCSLFRIEVYCFRLNF